MEQVLLILLIRFLSSPPPVHVIILWSHIHGSNRHIRHSAAPYGLADLLRLGCNYTVEGLQQQSPVLENNSKQVTPCRPASPLGFFVIFVVMSHMGVPSR